MSDILEKNAGFKWLRNLNKRDGTARNFVLLRKVIRLSNRLVAAEKERDSWKAKAEANERDKSRMDYLERNVVTVAAPPVYGSRSLFCCGPYRDDCVDELPSSIRQLIDAARSVEKEQS